MSTIPVDSPLISILQRLGKHEPNGAAFGALTLRYADSQVAVARHLGTGLLTSML